MSTTHLTHPIRHTHGPSCGHDAVVHLDHVDYLHDGTWEHEHEGHYDACAKCDCADCSDSCVACVCADCTCATCVHTKCQCADCSDSCASCVCADCTCATCKHAA